MSRIIKRDEAAEVVLPDEALSRAGLAVGDEVSVLPIQDGVLVIAKASAQGRMLTAALGDMERRPELYRRLAE